MSLITKRVPKYSPKLIIKLIFDLSTRGIIHKCIFTYVDSIWSKNRTVTYFLKIENDSLTESKEK